MVCWVGTQRLDYRCLRVQPGRLPHSTQSIGTTYRYGRATTLLAAHQGAKSPHSYNFGVRDLTLLTSYITYRHTMMCRCRATGRRRSDGRLRISRPGTPRSTLVVVVQRVNDQLRG